MWSRSKPIRSLIVRCQIRFQDAIARGRLRVIEGAVAPPSAGEKLTRLASLGALSGELSDEQGRRDMRGSAGSTGGRDESSPGSIFERYCRALGHARHDLKIDVEGVDRLVLDGLNQFEARPRYVSIESGKVDFAALRAEMALMRDLRLQGGLRWLPTGDRARHRCRNRSARRD